jgi:8-oxo-dGTP diphosphatase
VNEKATVHAAGGVVLRRTSDGAPEVLLVHRPRYDDWSIPKGKLEVGETHEAAAVREVQEETGLLAELGAELPSSRYVDRHGRDKVVRYWLMTPITQGAWAPNDEVDDVVWISPGDAGELLTYDADRRLLASALREGRGGTP